MNIEKSLEQKKVKKAAILTWCDNNGPTNYGQILQCYAMQKLVESWGYYPIIVQYRNKDERDFVKHNFSNRNSVGRWLNERYEKAYNIKVIEKEETPRVRAFKNFINENIHLTSPCYTRQAVEYETKDCELLVCGSDQIWNPIWFNPIWFLDFGTKEQKRVAYAPSGIFFEGEEEKACYTKMTPLLNKLDVITIREQLGADIISKYTEKEVCAVLDPTLLMDVSQWNKVAAERIIEDNYIFCYIMGSIRPYQLVLRKLMEKHGADKVVYIPSNLMTETAFTGFEKFETAGPSEFLSLIKYAKAVCTDSFHGTALSIIYEKQFYNVKRAHSGTEKFGGEQRVDNLLAKLSITGRTVNCVKDICVVKSIYYDSVNNQLEMLREQSKIFPY